MNSIVHLAAFSAPLSDEKLYELCQKYGLQARLWRQKFIGLLPEVSKRKLYEKKGFVSIFEFAAKLAGLSEKQVRRVLHLNNHFQDKPILKKMLEDGEVSVNKLIRVTSVVTRENQEFWASQIKLLSQRALETFIRDVRLEESNLQKPFLLSEGVHVHTQLHLNSDVEQKLLELQNKGIDINKLILEFLEKRELEIASEKEKIAAEVEAQECDETAEIGAKVQGDKSAGGDGRKVRNKDEATRYIPVRIKKLIKQEYGTKCSMPTCKKEAEIIHHTQRFAMSKNHNPHYLAQLCREHHMIAHSIDMKFQRFVKT